MGNSNEIHHRYGVRPRRIHMSVAKYEFMVGRAELHNTDINAFLWMEKGIENWDVLSKDTTEFKGNPIYN